ncbi:hypothetical protein K2173_013370 [Erythroxylum novogranatense]|uniref:Rieske domain-containing protein n=1 Tax=Erythroxylum novogranatense TaxID=1862640 RepID=A0AAV8SA70_9ROSI|nr:hypothetical protein K2173_013370 [Erythroxylum novogranatense]
MRKKDPPEPEVEDDTKAEKFDWFSHWYPVMPVCDLDKRVPHAKKVMGLDVVVWWSRNEKTWKVFDDACPHRLAPLSEGRIDQWGRLQCVYHGWCFNGSGDCKSIPQAPPDGPPDGESNFVRAVSGHFVGRCSADVVEVVALREALTVILECKQLLRARRHFKVCWVRRQANVEAHTLARVSHLYASRVVGIHP